MIEDECVLQAKLTSQITTFLTCPTWNFSFQVITGLYVSSRAVYFILFQAAPPVVIFYHLYRLKYRAKNGCIYLYNNIRVTA